MHLQNGTDVKNLSDRRLWEILRQAEVQGPCIAAALVELARAELGARRQDDEARRFRAPA
jgi:hypothetical protein